MQQKLLALALTTYLMAWNFSIFLQLCHVVNAAKFHLQSIKVHQKKIIRIKLTIEVCS
ncbi:hypothetical protein FDUTEX481_01183 [Tolypothrix sp. PCC 7601]|nr:hypothetical protein FDUTEX481_01183 [Tolypothrix sp. PCC 7601]